MPKYTYTAENSAGQQVTGVVDGKNKRQATEEIRKQGLDPISVEEKKSIWNISFGKTKIRVKVTDMLVFTRQLATMLSAGIPLLETLEILAEQAEDPGFRACVTDIAENVRSGNDFSDSLGRYPKVFDHIYINMIRAGEASGQLDEILARLAEYQEAAYKLKMKVRSAMMYPMISMVMIGGISGFLLVFIIPKFKKIFVSLNVPLPLPTAILMAIGDWLANNFLIWASGAAVIIWLIKRYKNTQVGKRQFDWLALKLPVFGVLNMKVALSRFARTFSTLIESGVPILQALEIVATTCGNSILEDVVNEAMESVRQGETLATPLEDSGVFPSMVTRMIEIGEKSGALELLLRKLSEFYDQQIESMVENLTSLIEPLMIAVMGVVVGGMVMAVFLPMFDLIGKLSG